MSVLALFFFNELQLINGLFQKAWEVNSEEIVKPAGDKGMDEFH